MAPPNRYTNSSRSMTGRASEVRTASRLRLVRRRQRPAMAGQSATTAQPAGGTVPHPAEPRSRCRPMLDIGGLLPLLVLVVVVGLLGGVAGKGLEHVVEGGPVHGEPVHGPAGRVDLVEQGPHLGGTPVGGPPDGEALTVAPGHPAAQQ